MEYITDMSINTGTCRYRAVVIEKRAFTQWKTINEVTTAVMIFEDLLRNSCHHIAEQVLLLLIHEIRSVLLCCICRH
jgi:hypothetical protein